jgi:hypothetical protein
LQCSSSPSLFSWGEAGPEFEPKHHCRGNREHGDCSASKNGLNNLPVSFSTNTSINGAVIMTVAHLETSVSTLLPENIYTHKWKSAKFTNKYIHNYMHKFIT